MKRTLCFICGLVLSTQVYSVTLTGESLSDYPEAICNSGSPASVYVKWNDPLKIALLFDGGDAARSATGFRNRSESLKESRLHDMKETTREMTFIYDELDQSGYSIINVPYCSSDIYMGDHEHEIRNKAVPFKGSKILSAVMQRYGAQFDAADILLVGGFSAGTIATSYLMPEIEKTKAKQKRYVLDSFWMDEQEIEARLSLSSSATTKFIHKSLPDGCENFLDCYPSDKRLSALGVTDAFIVWNRGDLYRLSRDDDSHKQLMDKTFAKVSGGIALGRGYGVKGVSGDHVILNAPAYEQAVNGTTIASVFKQWLNEGKSHFVTDNSPEYKGIPVTERLTVKEGKAGFNKKALPTAVLLGDLDCDGNDTLQKQVTSSSYNFVWIDHCKGRTRKGDSLNRIKQATSAVLPEDQIIDAFDAISWINQQDWHEGPVVLIGQAMGGAAINYLAYGRTRDRILERSSISAEAMSLVSGLVSYYPFCAVGRMPPTADIPYLSFIAGNDDLDQGMNGCNVIADKKTGEMLIKYIPDAPHGFDKEAYAGDKMRTGIMKGNARYKIAYDSKSEKAASKELKAFLSVVR